MMIVSSVQELIGNTPVFKFDSSQVPIPDGSEVYAKLEYLNPGGSIKDRLGEYLLEQAIARGDVHQDSVIVEPTAGNTGIGIALAAQARGIRVIFVVPEKFSEEKQYIMRALGAEIINTPTSEGIKGAIAKAEELQKTLDNVYLPAQFSNVDNPMTYYSGLGPEILAEVPDITSFVAGVGSGGTFAGVGKYLRDKKPDVRLVAVEPRGSVLQGGESNSHDIEGIGVEFIPPFLQDLTIDHVSMVNDPKGFRHTKILAQQFGLIVGSSSGAAFAAALHEAQKLPAGSKVVTIFADSGDRYLSKNIYTYPNHDES